MMRLTSGILFVFVWIAVAGTSVASAKRVPLLPMFLKDPIMINGAEVPSGSYLLSVESQGPTVQVTVWRNDQFVAAARGAWVKSGIRFAEDALVVRVNPDGTRSLIEIRLGGTEKAIVLQDPETAMKLSAK
jgi:hypothetical protein